MTIEIVDFPIKNGGSFHSYVAVYQRVIVLPMIRQLITPCPNLSKVSERTEGTNPPCHGGQGQNRLGAGGIPDAPRIYEGERFRFPFQIRFPMQK